MDGYVVVVFGGASPGWCGLSHCPAHAHGPLTRVEAEALAARVTAAHPWLQPHVLPLEPGGDACAPGVPAPPAV